MRQMISRGTMRGLVKLEHDVKSRCLRARKRAHRCGEGRAEPRCELQMRGWCTSLHACVCVCREVRALCALRALLALCELCTRQCVDGCTGRWCVIRRNGVHGRSGGACLRSESRACCHADGFASDDDVTNWRSVTSWRAVTSCRGVTSCRHLASWRHITRRG